MHQILELSDPLFQQCRAKFSARKEFWNQLRCTIRILVFSNWEHLLKFMISPPEEKRLASHTALVSTAMGQGGTMTLEDIVRKQHELEDRIALFKAEIDRFLKLAFRSLDVRQHEIAMARLYDSMTSAESEPVRIDCMFKGFLLKKTHSKHKAEEKPSLWSRFKDAPAGIDMLSGPSRILSLLQKN